MTEEEEHDDIVRRVIFTRFRSLPEWYDDLYQEGRLALLVMEAPKDEHWGHNAFRWVTRCCWRYLFRQWGYYKEGKESKKPIFIDADDIYTDVALTECTGYSSVLTQQLLSPLSERERELIVHYYVDEATAEECAELTEYTKASTREMISYIRKKILHYEETGRIPRKYKKTRVLDTQSGIYFKTAVQAAAVLGVDPVTLRRWLSGDRKNPTSLVYA